MRFGTLDEQKELIAGMEEVMNDFTELSMTHIHLKLHTMPSSA
jgi:hypothetical protein